MKVKRIPSTSLSQSQSMQLANENVLSRFPQVEFVFSRTGTPDLAADPMPPSASDTYIILRPREQWPDRDLAKDDLIRQFDTEASKLPGNKFGFSQPIEMRFNELIAGVREDLAVKVFGDEFAANGARRQPDRRRAQRGRRCGQCEGRTGLGTAVSGDQDRQG
ncbi:MAG: efflux RND transporter permease subunit [Stellaceae bacterium]